MSTVTPAASSVPSHHGNQQQARPSPPRGRLEPSRSLGQLSVRPGSATRLVEGGCVLTSGGTGSPQLQHHPLQQLEGVPEQAEGQGHAVSAVKHQHKHLSRSASDGFVTVPPSVISAAGVTSSPSQQQHPSPTSPQHQHILSPSPSSFTPVQPPSSPRRRQSEPSQRSSPASPRRPDTPPPPPGAVTSHTPSPPREGSEGSNAKGRLEGETTTEAATVSRLYCVRLF